MSEGLAERWCHSMDVIVDPKLRTDYLRAQLLSYSVAHLALGLREIFDRTVSGYPRAKRVVTALVPALAHPEIDDKRTALTTFAIQGEWSDLCDWLGCHTNPAAKREAADEDEDDPTPKTRPGDRVLTLGERKSLARQPTRAALGHLLRDPHPAVIKLLLDNAAMTEDRVVRLSARRPGLPAILRLVAAHALWCARPRVRSALVQNPHTPPFIAAPLVSLLPLATLDEILQIPRTAAWVKRAAIRARRHGADRGLPI